MAVSRIRYKFKFNFLCIKYKFRFFSIECLNYQLLEGCDFTESQHIVIEKCFCFTHHWHSLFTRHVCNRLIYNGDFVRLALRHLSYLMLHMQRDI